jgi:hypothetical protein
LATETPTSAPPIRYASLSEIVGQVQIRSGIDGVWVPVTAEALIAPGTALLTGQNSRAKITLAEGNLIRLGSQTQFMLLESSGSDSDPSTRAQLDFGKVWAIIVAPLNNGLFEIQLPVGLAAVRGSFLSAEYNSTTNGIVVSCLEGHCHYENANGALDFTTLQQAVSINGSAPNLQPISANQLNDWAPLNIPEVLTLTPPPTETPRPTETPTVTPSRTPRPTQTPIPIRTLPPTRTPTNTRTPKPSATASNTPTVTSTVGPTATFGAPAKLAFTVQPINVPIGAAFKVEVTIQDANGITVVNATEAVSLSIGANGGAGTLAGVTAIGPVNGVATFLVSLDKAGAYTLIASAPGLTSATSPAFEVVDNSALLFVISNLPNEVSVDQSVTITVTAIETNGSVSRNYLGTLKFQSSDGQAILPADYSFTTSDQGSHTFTLIFRTTGNQSLKVSDSLNPTLVGYAGTVVK